MAGMNHLKCCCDPCANCPDGTPATMLLTLDSVTLTAGCFFIGDSSTRAQWVSTDIDGTYCMAQVPGSPCAWAVQIPCSLQLYIDAICAVPGTLLTFITAFIVALPGGWSGLFLNFNPASLYTLDAGDSVGVFDYNGGSGVPFTSCNDPFSLTNDDNVSAVGTTGGTADITPGPC